MEAERFTFANENEAVNFIKCNAVLITNTDGSKSIEIQTLEGVLRAERGDWIIKGVKDEISVCKPDIFEENYAREE